MILTFGGHDKEDAFWSPTLAAVAQQFRVQNPEIETKSVCVDCQPQERIARNPWHSAMIRSVFQTVTRPFGGGRRRSNGGKIAPHE